MGERKGQNKYYPPDFDYKKHKSLAGYHGEHPLRERAKKIGQGILVIRFEMPYNIWCGGCGIHIAMGVRYNAEKSKIGKYYTTPIYKFRMKCHLCDNYFEIKTDPANHDYVIIEGARRKEQRWDPKENEQIVPDDRASQKKMATDAMYKLEHGSDDKAKIKKAAPGLIEISDRQSQWKEDYMINKALRKQFRDKKKALTAAAESDKALLEKSSLDITLLPEHEDDVRMAGLLKYQNLQSYDEKQRQKRHEIETRPIFASSSGTSTGDNKKSTVLLARKKLGLSKASSSVSPFAQTSSKPLHFKELMSIGIVQRKSKNHDSAQETRSQQIERIDPEKEITVRTSCDLDLPSSSNLDLPSPSDTHNSEEKQDETCKTCGSETSVENKTDTDMEIAKAKFAWNSLISSYESPSDSGSDST